MTDSIIITPPSLKVEKLADPRAGFDLNFGVPANRIYLIYSLHLHFTAGAGGGNRNILLKFTDGTNDYLDCPISSDVPATDNHHYTWAVGLAYHTESAVNADVAPLPFPLYLKAFSTIITETVNLQALDQFDEVYLYYSIFKLEQDRG